MTRTLDMGRSISITYTVQMFAAGQLYTPSEWRTRARGPVPGQGKPTNENLAKYVAAFEESTRGNGCNKHLGVCKIASAKIVDQRTSAVIATYVAA